MKTIKVDEDTYKIIIKIKERTLLSIKNIVKLAISDFEGERQ